MDSQMAVSVGKSLLPAAFAGARWILVICLRKMAAKSTGDQRQILESLTTRLQPDTQTILETLKSIQLAKLLTAKQHIDLAIKDLGAWKNEESEIDFDSTRPILELTDVKLFRILIHSEHYHKAMHKLEIAYTKASDVFNGKQNEAKVRLQALDIMIFSITLQYWQNGVGLFKVYQTLFEFLFYYHPDLAQYAFCKQKKLARLFRKGHSSRLQMAHMLRGIACVAEQMARHYTSSTEVIFLQALDFSKFIEDKSNSLLMKTDISVARNALPESWCYEHDREFILTNNPYSYTVPETGEHRRYNIALFSSGEKLLLTSEHLFSLTVIKSGTIWGINYSMNAIVSIDLNEGPENRKLINNKKKWIIIGCAQDKNRVYAKAAEDNYISVIDTETKDIIECEKILLPTKVAKGLNFEWGDGVAPGQEMCYIVAPNGFILFYAVKPCNRFALILHKGKALWYNIMEPVAAPNSNPETTWNYRPVSFKYPSFPYWRDQPFEFNKNYPLTQRPPITFESMSEFANSKIITLDSTDGHTCVIRIGFGPYFINELFVEIWVYKDDSVIFKDFDHRLLSLGLPIQLFKGQKLTFEKPVLFTMYQIHQYIYLYSLQSERVSPLSKEECMQQQHAYCLRHETCIEHRRNEFVTMNSVFLRFMRASIDQNGKMVVYEYRPQYGQQSLDVCSYDRWPHQSMVLHRNFVVDSDVIFAASGGFMQQSCYLSSDISNKRLVPSIIVPVLDKGVFIDWYKLHPLIHNTVASLIRRPKEPENPKVSKNRTSLYPLMSRIKEV